MNAASFYRDHIEGLSLESRLARRALIRQAYGRSAAWGDPLGDNPPRLELLKLIDKSVTEEMRQLFAAALADGQTVTFDTPFEAGCKLTSVEDHSLYALDSGDVECCYGVNMVTALQVSA